MLSYAIILFGLAVVDLESIHFFVFFLACDKTTYLYFFSLYLIRSFKTFKLKKKSSTLGINKTSESPPLLRRDEDRYGSQTTFDGRMRHTVDIGLGNDFQRGTPCRSSLQDLNSTSSVRHIFYFDLSCIQKFNF